MQSDDKAPRHPDYDKLVTPFKLDEMAKKNIEEVNEETAKKIQDNIQVLIVTANHTEQKAVLYHLEPLDNFHTLAMFHYSTPIGVQLNATYICGKYGALNAAVQLMVEQGPAAAQNVVSAAAQCFSERLNAIFAVGVACGSSKSNYLDVLISKKVSFYTAARIGTEGGGYKITNRGVGNLGTSQFFLTRFQTPPHCPEEVSEITKSFTKKPNRCLGLILSGDYLVDNKDFRDELLKVFAPEAIGIEMEGAGLFHDYAHGHNLHIMIVKGVCDFGDGKKSKEYQPTAALLAAECVKHYLKSKQLPRQLAQACKKPEPEQIQPLPDSAGRKATNVASQLKKLDISDEEFTLPGLVQYLRNVDDWSTLALFLLPNDYNSIPPVNVLIPKDEVRYKNSLLKKYDQIARDRSWKEVVKRLERAGENGISANIKKDFHIT